MLRPNLVGYSASRGSAPATWTLDDRADHVAARMREPVDELVHIVGHSVVGAGEQDSARTGEGLQMALLRRTCLVRFDTQVPTFVKRPECEFLT